MAAKKKSPQILIPGHQPYLKGDARWRATVNSWPEHGHQRLFFRDCVKDYRPAKPSDDLQVAYWAYVTTWTMAYHLDDDLMVHPGSQRGSEIHPRDGAPPELKRARVGVLHYVDPVAKIAYALGYGEVVGYEVPPAGTWGSVGSPHKAGVQSPRIHMDNDTIVWGCESWWLPEADMKAFLSGLIRKSYDVKPADIAQYRRDGDRKFEISEDTGWTSRFESRQL